LHFSIVQDFDKKRKKLVTIDVYWPHEVGHVVYRLGSKQFDSQNYSAQSPERGRDPNLVISGRARQTSVFLRRKTQISFHIKENSFNSIHFFLRKIEKAPLFATCGFPHILNALSKIRQPNITVCSQFIRKVDCFSKRPFCC